VRFTAPKVAVNVACPNAFPGTTKVTVALLAGTVTLGGAGETVGLLLARLTTIPPAGATPLRVTVAIDIPPRTIWNGLSVRAVSTGGGGATVSVAVRLTPASVAVIVVCPAAFPGMEMGALVVLPAATVTLAGTGATCGLLLVRLTTTPPGGAIPLSVTVAVDVPPTIIWSGFSVRVVKTGVTTVSVAVRLTPASVAVIIVCPRAFPGMLKVTLVLPAAIVRLAGTGATGGLLLVRLTTTPPAGAIPLSVTVMVDLPPRTI